MEGRAHSSKSYTSQNSASRMMQDLSVCSEKFARHSEQQSATQVTNKPATGTEKRQNLHVGIIGAGLAGLRCAEILVEKGIKTTIIEARDRLGGRIHGASFLGRLIDMGPNWIHGTNDNPLLKLAQNTDTYLSSPEETTHIYDSNGVLVDRQKSSEYLEILWDILVDAFRCSNEHCATIPPNISLKDFFQEKLSASLLDKGVQKFVLEVAEMWGSFIGDSFEEQSLKWFWLEECLDGDNLFLPNTHQAIIDHVARPVVSKGIIHFGTRAQSIKTQHKRRGDEKVTVKTTNGSFDFDQVVVTIPLGCLQMRTVEFLPKLPASISSAIAGASYSRLEKVYLFFPVAFWERPTSVIPNIEDAKLSEEHKFPIFSHFLRPNYVPEEQRSWTLDMVALSSFAAFGAYAQPVLLFYLWGASAAHVTSAVADLAPSGDEYYKLIDRLFRPFYSRLPNFGKDQADCTPSAVLASNWQNDELAGKGSYTNFKKAHVTDGEMGGVQAVDDGFRAIRDGVPERGLWFAGEHTAPFVALGTSTGAYWSGEAAATQITSYFSSSDLNKDEE